jgi:hypothetical protein
VATGQSNLILEVKKVDSNAIMFVGPQGGSIDTRTDLSAYTLAAGSFIYADQQNRPSVPSHEIVRHAYAEEPVIAHRVTLVDDRGENVSDANPLPIDGNITVTSSGIKNPTILNISTLSNTEITIPIPKDAKKYLIKARDYSKMTVAYVSGSVNFITVSMGTVYSEDSLILDSILNIYVKTTKNDIVELLYWT